MQNHDSIKELENLLGNDDLMRRISPKFQDLSFDIHEIVEYSKNPVFIAVLLFKLTEEREKTNKLLEKIYDRFDQIMLKLKTAQAPAARDMPMLRATAHLSEVLPEQDQLIMHLVQEKGQITAEDVRSELGYKGKNAASQRLNKLFKDGHLRKIQSGRRVLYLARI